MTPNTQQATDLRIYTDDSGVVWFRTAKEFGRACASELSVDDFLNQPIMRNIKTLHILGFRSNAELICKLHEARNVVSNNYHERSPLPLNIKIGTPMCVPSAARTDPSAILTLMSELDLPYSCGGWHELTQHDYRMYDLVRKCANTETLTADMLDALRNHPAYLAVSFVNTFDEYSSAKMLAEIIDPRWFVDPLNPDRTSRLRKYMGMRLDQSNDMFDFNNQQDLRAVRAQLLCRSWSGGKASTASLNFLYRMLTSDTSGSQDKRFFKACLKYLHFVRAVWLDQLAAKDRTLFVPEYFFEDEFDVAKYKLHAKLS